MRHISTILFIILFTPILLSQELLEDEKALFKAARKEYFSGNFEQAVLKFSHLASVEPKNTTYKYYLGISFLKSKADRYKSIEYLEFAKEDPQIPNEIYFYLAKAYHLVNRFDDAIAVYKKFGAMLSIKDSKQKFIERQIEMCNNGKVLVRNHLDVVLDAKKIINKAPAYGHYDIGALGGKVIKTPDHYKSSEDKKKDLNNVLFMAYNKDRLFYTSKGIDGFGGQDIHMVKKLPNGEWALPQVLDSTINTPYDEGDPFLHPDGKTLYFSSEGHNSMGGLDIFRSEFVKREWPEKGYWAMPENLGYPINSSDDDEFFIADFDQEYAYFSSGRETEPGKMEVYKIKLPKKPIPATVIKGIFTHDGTANTNEVTITVLDKESNANIGVFNSNSLSGEYVISIPPGKDYNFIVDAEGFLPHFVSINVPVQTSLYTLYQEINLQRTPSGQKIMVNNDFGSPVEGELAYEMAKAESKDFAVLQIENTLTFDDEKEVETMFFEGRVIQLPATSSVEVKEIPREEFVHATSTEIEFDASEKTIDEPTFALRDERMETSSTKVEPITDVELESKEMNAELLDEYQISEDQSQFSDDGSVFEDSEKQDADSDQSVEFNEDISSEDEFEEEELAFYEEPTEEIVLESQEESPELSLDDTDTKITEDISDEVIEEPTIDIVFAYSDELKQSAIEKSFESEIAFSNAVEAKDESQQMAEKAKEIRSGAENESNEEMKQQEFAEADKLEEQARQKFSEAKLSYDYARELKVESEAKAALSEEIMASVNSLKETEPKNENKKRKKKKSSEVSDQEQELEKQKREEELQLIFRGTMSYAKELRIEAGQKEEKGVLALKYAKKLEQDSEDKMYEAVQVRKKAEDIKVEKEKDVELKEADRLEDEALEIKSDANIAFDYAEELKQDAQQRNQQADLLVKRASLIREKTEVANIIEEDESLGLSEPEEKNRLKLSGHSAAYAKEIEYVTKEIRYQRVQTSQQDDMSASNSKAVLDETIEQPSDQSINGQVIYESETSTTRLTSEEGQRDEEVMASSDDESYIDEDEEFDDIFMDEEGEKIGETEEVASNEIGSDESSEGIGEMGDMKRIKGSASQSKEAKDEQARFESASSEKDLALNEESSSYEEVSTSDQRKINAGVGRKEEDESVNKGARGESLAEDKNSVSTSREIRSTTNQDEKRKKINAPVRQKTTKENLVSFEEEMASLSKEIGAEEEPQQVEDIIASAESERDQPSFEEKSSLTKDEEIIVSAASEKDQASFEEKSNLTEDEEIFASNDNAASQETRQELATVDNKLSSEQGDFTSSNDNEEEMIDKEDNREITVFAADKQSTEIEDNAVASNETTPKESRSPKNKKKTPLRSEEPQADQESSVQEIASSDYQVEEESFALNETTADQSTSQENLEQYDDQPVKDRDESSLGFGQPVQLSNEELTRLAATYDTKNDKKLFIFSISKKVTYSKKKPIPVDDPIPEGLIFKVQVGAFRNPIPQKLFGNLTPVRGENTSMGFIRYTVGLFRAYESANLVRSEINSIGFKDAFVVSYFNGKRITLGEALAILSGSTPDIQMAYKEVASKEKQKLAGMNIFEDKYQGQQIIPVSYELREGTFFSVQIGAFSNPVSTSNFPAFDPKNINGELSPSGLIRYTVGNFNEFDPAIASQDKIRTRGIADAFVVAYVDGKRVPLEKVKDLTTYLASNETQGTTTASVTKPPPPPPTVQEEVPVSYSGEKPIFKVQIGAYDNRMPKGFRKIIKNNPDVSTEMAPNGFTRYMVGLFANYNEAEKLRDDFRTQGIKDSYVVAYLGDKRISIPNAISISQE